MRQNKKKRLARSLVVLVLVLAMLIPATMGALAAEDATGAAAIASDERTAALNEQQDTQTTQNQQSAGVSSAQAEQNAEEVLKEEQSQNVQMQTSMQEESGIRPFSSAIFEPGDINNNLITNFYFMPHQTDLQSGSGTQVDFFMTTNLTSPGTEDSKTYKDVEIRIYFGDSFPLLDTSNIADLFKFDKYNGKSKLVIPTEEGQEPYLSFKIPEIVNATTGVLRFPIKFMNGITPNGKQLNLSAEFWYRGEGSDYVKIEEVKAENNAIVNRATINWRPSVSISPSTYTVPLSPGDLTGPFNFVVSARNQRPAAVQYATSFQLENTITVPNDLTVNKNDFTLIFSGKMVTPENAADLGISDISIEEESPRVFKVKFSYTPAQGQKPADAADFNYTVQLSKVYVAATMPQASSRSISFVPDLKVLGYGEEATDASKWITSTGNTANLIFRKQAVDETVDAQLGSSLRVNKALDYQEPDGFTHGQEVSFTIKEIGFGKDAQGRPLANAPYMVQNFSLTDDSFDSHLVPTRVALGVTKDGNTTIRAKELVLTIGTKQYVYTIAPGDSVLDLTSDAILENAMSGTETAKEASGDIKAIRLNYGDVSSNFNTPTPPKFVFTVKSTSADDRISMQNKASIRFDFSKVADKPKEYSASATATAQLAANDLPKISLSKTVENLTSGNINTTAPGELMRYTITLRNDSSYSSGRVMQTPNIRDILPTTYLDIDSLTVKETDVKLSGTRIEDTDLALKLPSRDDPEWTGFVWDPDKTCYTDLVAVTDGSEVRWEFDGSLKGGQTITITYTIQVKGRDDLEAELGPIGNEPLSFHNHVWVYNHEANAEVKIPEPIARPYVDYSLTAPVSNTFKTDTPGTATFTAKVSNKENPYDGSKNIDKLVLAGKLANGFSFEVGDLTTQADFDHIATLFQLTRLGRALGQVYSGYTFDGTPGEAGEPITLSYQDGGGQDLYKVTLYYNSTTKLYDSFVMRMEAQPTDLETGAGGLLRYDTSEEIELAFTAQTPTSSVGFAGGYTTNFQTEIRAYLWDTKINEADSQPYLDCLTASSSKAKFRFDSKDGKTVSYIADSGDMDRDSSTQGALSEKASMFGELASPVLQVLKYNRTYGVLNPVDNSVVSYEIILKNHSVTPFTIEKVLDVLPEGQEYIANTAKGSLNGTPSEALSVTENGSRLTFEPSTPVSLTGNQPAGDPKPSFVSGQYTITFQAKVLDTYMDGQPDWVGRLTLQNQAGLVFDGIPNNIFRGTSPSSAVFPIIEPATEAWNNTPDGKTVLAASAAVTYGRDRIAPSIKKSIQNEPLVKKDGVELTWMLDVQNLGGSYGFNYMNNPYVVDILPPNLTYIAGSATFAGSTLQDPEILPIKYDFEDGKGVQDATLLVWKPTGVIRYGSSLRLQYKTVVEINEAQDPENIPYGTRMNVAFVAPNKSEQHLFYGTDIGVGTYVPNLLTRLSQNDPSLTPAKFSELGLDLAASSKAQSSSYSFGIWGEFNLDYYKEVSYNGKTVKSSNNAPAYVTVPRGGNFEYHLVVNNASNNNMYDYTEVVMIDTLPFVGDSGVVTQTNRGSEFKPELDLDNITVWIANKDGSTIPLSGSDYNIWFQQGGVGSAYTSGDWMIAGALDEREIWYQPGDAEFDENEIIGIRVQLGANKKLTSGQKLFVSVPMTVPQTMEFPEKPTNEYTAWNNFGFRVVIHDNLRNNNITLERMEALKVGARVTDTQNGTINLSKVIQDTTGNDITMLSDSSFNVVVTGPAGYSKSVTLSSANNYKTAITGLALGRYTITETTDQNGTPVENLYRVEVWDSDKSTLLPDSEISITQIPEQVLNVQLINQQKTGTLNITKTFSDSSPVDNITFVLKNNQTGQSVTAATDINGELQMNGIVWGSYTLFEQCPDGYTPGGFIESADQTDAMPDHVLFEKSITFPTREHVSQYNVVSNLDVQNVSPPAVLNVAKTWNGSAKQDGSTPEFFLMPDDGKGYDENRAIHLVYTAPTGSKPGVFSADTLAPGAYKLYEITESKYTPKGAALISNNYIKQGSQTPYSLYLFNEIVNVSRQNATEMTVNNAFYVPPVPTPTPSPTPTPTPTPSPTPTSTPIPTQEPSVGPSVEPTAEPTNPPRPTATPTWPRPTATPGPSVLPSVLPSTTPIPSPLPSTTETQSAAPAILDNNNGSGGQTNAAADAQEVKMQELFDKQTGNILQDIANGNVPLGNFAYSGSWSLFNLICAVAALIISIITFITIVMNRNKKEEQSEKKRLNTLKILTIAVGLLTGILFLILENMKLPMTLINQWTPLILAVFIIHLVALMVQIAVKRRYQRDDNDTADLKA